jgi:hypothetical protein
VRKHKRAAQREARGLPEFATRQQRQTPAAEGIKAAQQEQQAWDAGQPEKAKEFTTKAFAAGYDALLQLAMEYADIS